MSLEDKIYSILKIYEASPQWLKHLAGTVYRYIPSSIRYGKSYPKFQHLVQDSYHWTENEIQHYQLKELKKSITEAWKHCPYYRNSFEKAGVSPKDLNTLEDIKKFPTLRKQDLIKNEKKLASTNIPKKKRLRITTGGSTGIPVGFYLEKGISRPKEQAYLEGMWKRIGYTTKSKVAVIRGHVTSRFFDGKISYTDPTRNWLVLSSYHLTESRLEEYLNALEKFQPDFLHFYPSSALQLAELMQKTGKQCNFKVKGMLCGSERLELPQKRILEKAFKCPVFRWYGHAERVALAGEGLKSEYFYFWPSYGYTELGQPDKNGYREIIATSFHNHAMPFIRYRTGDYVLPVDEDAELEYPWLAVKAVAGREQEFLITDTGRKISLTAFNMHDGIFDGLYAVQFHQKEQGRVELHYIAAEKLNPSQLKKIKQGVRKKLGNDFEVIYKQVKKTEKTPAGKHKWLVSELTD